jgi:WD40 repeat protein
VADDRDHLDRARPFAGPGRAVAASPDRRDVLAAFQAALRLEAHNLSRPGTPRVASFFWQQLSNRILWPSSPIGRDQAAALVEVESKRRLLRTSGVWLRQLSPMPESRGMTRTLAGHEGPVTSLAYSPDGTRLVSGSGDGTARVWDLAAGRETAVLGGYPEPVMDCGFSGDGTSIVTASAREVALWRADTGERIAALAPGVGGLTSCAISPDGALVVAGGHEGLKLVDLEAGTLTELRGHGAAVNSCRFSEDGAMAVSGDGDGVVIVWDVRAEVEALRIQAHDTGVWQCALSPDGTTVASAGGDSQTVKLWDARTGARKAILYGHEGPVVRCAFSRDGARLVSAGSHDLTVRIWDVATRGEIAVLRGHASPVFAVAISPSGDQVASGALDGMVKTWGVAASLGATTAPGHRDAVHCCAFSPVGDAFASGGGDGDRAVILWGADDRQMMHALYGHSGAVESCAFSPDGRTLISVGEVSVRAWDAATGTERPAGPVVYQDLSRRVSACAFSHDGRWLAVGVGADLYVWDTATGERAAAPVRQDGAVTCCTFAPDDGLMATASTDGNLRLWRTAGWVGPMSLAPIGEASPAAPSLRTAPCSFPRATTGRCAHGMWGPRR